MEKIDEFPDFKHFVMKFAFFEERKMAFLAGGKNLR